ncbi:MAG TPA: hypothetical protein VF173_10325 [Thermoanaerobaculia bacterium]|nr:hypothetical protein [Thermoanaerobaculia bacterium]
MKNALRTLLLAVAFTLCAFAMGYAADPVGICRIHCSDGTLAQFCDVFVRCRVQFNNICGGVGSYSWEETPACP